MAWKDIPSWLFFLQRICHRTGFLETRCTDCLREIRCVMLQNFSVSKFSQSAEREAKIIIQGIFAPLQEQFLVLLLGAVVHKGLTTSSRWHSGLSHDWSFKKEKKLEFLPQSRICMTKYGLLLWVGDNINTHVQYIWALKYHLPEWFGSLDIWDPGAFSMMCGRLVLSCGKNNVWTQIKLHLGLKIRT